MDMKDLDKELGDIKFPRVKPQKRVDLGVKNAGLKVVACKTIAVLFILALAIFGLYSMINAKSVGMDSKMVAAVVLVYVALGGLISYRLWRLDFVGWVVMLIVSLAGIVLPAVSAVNRGIMIGTVPIVAASLALLVALWWVRDLFRVKTPGDIFKPR